MAADIHRTHPGFVIVEEDVIMDFREIPLELMSEARRDFSDKNFGEAAGDLNAAARILRAEGKRAVNVNEAPSLKVVADNLDRLAKEVKGQEIKTEQQLNTEISKAAYLTASHHRFHAAAEWTKKEYYQAGHDLLIAAYALESGAKWSGKEIEKGTAEIVKGARFVAGKLIQGTGWTSKEVGKAFGKVGDETDRLGKKVL